MAYHSLNNRQPGSDRSSDPQSHRQQASRQDATDERASANPIEPQSPLSRASLQDDSDNVFEPQLNRLQAIDQDGSEESGSDKVNPALTRLFRTAESIHQTTQTLLDSVERQIEAIKTADLVRLEELTDTYATTLSQFREEEVQLIHEISRAAARAKAGESTNASESSYAGGSAKADGQVVRLRDLSALFPESAKKLDTWRNTLEQGVRSLSLKQEQLTRLLEFAVDQNSQLLSTVYQIINRDSSHYGPDGKASVVKPGSTVNHKA